PVSGRAGNLESGARVLSPTEVFDHVLKCTQRKRHYANRSRLVGGVQKHAGIAHIEIWTRRGSARNGCSQNALGRCPSGNVPDSCKLHPGISGSFTQSSYTPPADRVPSASICLSS